MVMLEERAGGWKLKNILEKRGMWCGVLIYKAERSINGLWIAGKTLGRQDTLRVENWAQRENNCLSSMSMSEIVQLQCGIKLFPDIVVLFTVI